MSALIEEFSLSTSLPWQVIVARLLLATLLGGVLGFEREIADRLSGASHSHDDFAGGSRVCGYCAGDQRHAGLLRRADPH